MKQNHICIFLIETHKMKMLNDLPIIQNRGCDIYFFSFQHCLPPSIISYLGSEHPWYSQWTRVGITNKVREDIFWTKEETKERAGAKSKLQRLHRKRGDFFLCARALVFEVLLGIPRHHGNVHISTGRKLANQYCCSSIHLHQVGV